MKNQKDEMEIKKQDMENLKDQFLGKTGGRLLFLQVCPGWTSLACNRKLKVLLEYSKA